MPTYDYQCNACKHRFEEFQAMSAAPLRKCPKCGKNALERLIGTGAAIIFKGSGFYQTDYRSDSYKKAAEAESKPAESPKPETRAADSAKPSDTKAATPPADKPAKAEPKPASQSKRSKRPSSKD